MKIQHVPKGYLRLQSAWGALPAGLRTELKQELSLTYGKDFLVVHNVNRSAGRAAIFALSDGLVETVYPEFASDFQTFAHAVFGAHRESVGTRTSFRVSVRDEIKLSNQAIRWAITEDAFETLKDKISTEIRSSIMRSGPHFSYDQSQLLFFFKRTLTDLAPLYRDCDLDLDYNFLRSLVHHGSNETIPELYRLTRDWLYEQASPKVDQGSVEAVSLLLS